MAAPTSNRDRLPCGSLRPHSMHEWTGQTTGTPFACSGQPPVKGYGVSAPTTGGRAVPETTVETLMLMIDEFASHRCRTGAYFLANDERSPIEARIAASLREAIRHALIERMPADGSLSVRG